MSDENDRKSKADQSAEHSLPQPPTNTKPFVDGVESEDTTTKSEKHEKPCCSHPRMSKKAEWSHVIVSSILVIVTIGVLVVYSRQLSQMTISAQAAKDGIDQAERNAHLDQRAWVTVIRGQLEKPLAVSEKPRVKLTIRNSGRTPALNVQVFSEVYIGATPRKGVFTGESASKAVIAPNSDMSSPREADKAIASETEINDMITKQQNAVCATGIISYCDIFKMRHQTEFCFFVTGRDLTENPIFLNSCETGNRVEKKADACPDEK